MIDYIESSPALLPLLIFLVFTHTHAHTCARTHTYKEREGARVRRSHQSGNNILLRRPFAAHSHKSLRQSHHPHCQRVIMHTHVHTHTHTLGSMFLTTDVHSALSIPLPGRIRMSLNGRNMTRISSPTHFTCDDSALALLKRRGCATTGRSVSRLGLHRLHTGAIPQ